jgi:hypothetical protein
LPEPTIEFLVLDRRLSLCSLDLRTALSALLIDAQVQPLREVQLVEAEQLMVELQRLVVVRTMVEVQMMALVQVAISDRLTSQVCHYHRWDLHPGRTLDSDGAGAEDQLVVQKLAWLDQVLAALVQLSEPMDLWEIGALAEAWNGLAEGAGTGTKTAAQVRL